MREYDLITNYIYLYHINKFILLPTYPESVTDSLSATYSSTTPISRSAPIYSYSYSGPRSIDVSLKLHRDMMQMINYNQSNINLNEIELGDDYVDTLVKQIQAIALPRYQTSSKMVNPPMVALRFGDEIYIKGVVTGGISVTYSGPLIDVSGGTKYAEVALSFHIDEVDPYDADTILTKGSFRGLSRTLERRIYKK